MPSISIAGQQAARDHVWSLLMCGFSVNGVKVPVKRRIDGDFEISYAPWIIDPSEPREVMPSESDTADKRANTGIPVTVAAPESAPSDAATAQPVSVSYKLDAATPLNLMQPISYTQQDDPTDAVTYYASVLTLARRIATFAHEDLERWSERVAPYLDKVRAECVETKQAGYMLAATKVDSAVADLICACGEWERDVATAVEAIKREVEK